MHLCAINIIILIYFNCIIISYSIIFRYFYITMEKSIRFKQAYEYLRSIGLAHTQKDIADTMYATPQNVSAAMKGKTTALTSRFLNRFNRAYGNVFNDDWLLYGEGEMLRPAQTPSISNSNVITGGTNTNVKMSVNNTDTNKVEEAEIIEDFETAPIIPSTWVKRQDFDIVEAIEDYGDELEQSKVAIAGTPIDAWHIIPDNSMYPHYQKGDKVALKNNPYKKIVPGRVYGIDSLPHGLLVRILFNTEGGFLARSFDKENYPDFVIDKEDINNILSVVCVVRL